jgi:hypothetical protein
MHDWLAAPNRQNAGAFQCRYFKPEVRSGLRLNPKVASAVRYRLQFTSGFVFVDGWSPEKIENVGKLAIPF